MTGMKVKKKNDLNLRVACPKCGGRCRVYAPGRRRRYMECKVCEYRFVGVTRRQLRDLLKTRKRRATEDDDPFAMGEEARAAGIGRGANPFVKSTAEWELWQRGWNDDWKGGGLCPA